MKVTFLGTRGNIEARSERHFRHSSLLVSYYGRRVMIDAGEDWLGQVPGIAPHEIVLTHAHPDHAWGLREGAPCPVYADGETLSRIERYPIPERRTVTHREPFEIGRMVFEAFPVDHSTRAPAVGYRVTAGKAVIFYVPDVVYIPDRSEALRGVQLFIGDGATVSRSMVRKIQGALVGHTPVRTQLTWCEREGVPRALFTHCGSGIVKAEHDRIEQEIQVMAAERGVEAGIAVDGLELDVP